MSDETKTIYTGYLPRPLQEILHSQLNRFNVLVLHRRFGKSVFAINEIIDQGLRCEKRNPQYAYIGVTYQAVKRIIWDLAKQYCKDIPGVEFNEAELRIDIPRPWMGNNGEGDNLRIILLSAENPNAVRGIYLDGCVLDEYAFMSPEIFTRVIRPALSDREGWCIFISTPQGMNHFYDLYEMAGKPENQNSWFRSIYKASETSIIPAKELEEARRTMSEEDYLQEYECSFTSSLLGSYYGKYMMKAAEENRITKAPYNPSFGVSTFWDLGVGDSTAIVFVQRVGREYHVIDHLEQSGKGLEYYAQELIKRNYLYVNHVLPHDAMARELGTGLTRLEQLDQYARKQGLGGRLKVVGKHKIDDGINEVRKVLSQCYFDEKKCERLIASLKAYQKKWDEKNQIFSDTPLHNWCSHSADAMRTFAMGRQYLDESSGFQSRNSLNNLPTMTNNIYDPFNYRGGGNQ